MRSSQEVHVLPLITTEQILVNLVCKGFFQNPNELKVPLSYLLSLTQAGSGLNPGRDVGCPVVLVASISEWSL
jgi:hypothetical protein